MYLSVGLGLALIKSSKKNSHDADDIPPLNTCDLNSATKFLSSVRKDIKKIVLEHQVHDDEIANLSALPEEKLISTCSPNKAPTATPVEESEKQHTLNASTCGTSRTAGIMLALMHAYDEHSHKPEVLKAIKHVASLL